MVPLLVPVIAAVLAYLGNSWLARRKERRDGVVKRTEAQIEQLYGPAYSLVREIFDAYDVKERLLTQQASGRELSDADKTAIEGYFLDHVFLPVHTKLFEVLSTKLHLVEAGRIPPSFDLYLQHVIQERAQRELWRLHRIDTSHVAGAPFSDVFFEDIARELMSLLARHQSQLRSSRAAKKGIRPAPELLSEAPLSDR